MKPLLLALALLLTACTTSHLPKPHVYVAHLVDMRRVRQIGRQQQRSIDYRRKRLDWEEAHGIIYTAPDHYFLTGDQLRRLPKARPKKLKVLPVGRELPAYHRNHGRRPTRPRPPAPPEQATPAPVSPADCLLADPQQVQVLRRALDYLQHRPK